MKSHHVAALALIGWALILTEPSPRTIKTGLPTKEVCEKAAHNWRASYKRRLKRFHAGLQIIYFVC